MALFRKIWSYMYSNLILNSSANATLFELPNAKQVYLSAIQQGAYEKLGRYENSEIRRSDQALWSAAHVGAAIILSVITWTSAYARGMAGVG